MAEATRSRPYRHLRLLLLRSQPAAAMPETPWPAPPSESLHPATPQPASPQGEPLNSRYRLGPTFLGERGRMIVSCPHP
jgi:hypothetical protein